MKNQFEFEEASKYLDRVLTFLREGKPEEEREEITPFTPDTVQRMFRKLSYSLKLKKWKGRYDPNKTIL